MWGGLNRGRQFDALPEKERVHCPQGWAHLIADTSILIYLGPCPGGGGRAIQPCKFFYDGSDFSIVQYLIIVQSTTCVHIRCLINDQFRPLSPTRKSPVLTTEKESRSCINHKVLLNGKKIIPNITPERKKETEKKMKSRTQIQTQI
jgi:hypothetical protein